MPKKILITIAAFALAGVCAIGVGIAFEPDTGVHVVSEDSPCPVAGCSGECHGYADIPQPDGTFEMECPEAGCASEECHAWDTLQGRYKQASDASMNVWILAPVILTVGLVVLVGALSKPKRDKDDEDSESVDIHADADSIASERKGE